MADEVLQQGVRGITDPMVMPGLINLDFADVRSVMSEMGKAMMGTGEAGWRQPRPSGRRRRRSPTRCSTAWRHEGRQGRDRVDHRRRETCADGGGHEAVTHIKNLVDPDADYASSGLCLQQLSSRARSACPWSDRHRGRAGMGERRPRRSSPSAGRARGAPMLAPSAPGLRRSAAVQPAAAPAAGSARPPVASAPVQEDEEEEPPWRGEHLPAAQPAHPSRARGGARARGWASLPPRPFASPARRRVTATRRRAHVQDRPRVPRRRSMSPPPDGRSRSTCRASSASRTTSNRTGSGAVARAPSSGCGAAHPWRVGWRSRAKRSRLR